MILLLMHNFIIPCIGHWKNIGSLSYTDFPMLTDFIMYYNIFKITYINPLITLEVFYILGSYQAQRGRYKCLKMLFSLENSTVTDIVSSP